MKSFLIADDSDGKMMLLEALIKKSGLEVDIYWARSTEIAKKLIDEHKPAFAFIDYEMPTELGPAVIKYLRKAVPEAKIAMVSSSNSEKYQSDAADAGADTYICSSFEPDLVAENVLNLLLEWDM